MERDDSIAGQLLHLMGSPVVNSSCVARDPNAHNKELGVAFLVTTNGSFVFSSSLEGVEVLLEEFEFFVRFFPSILEPKLDNNPCLVRFGVAISSGVGSALRSPAMVICFLYKFSIVGSYSLTLRERKLVN